MFKKVIFLAVCLTPFWLPKFSAAQQSLSSNVTLEVLEYYHNFQCSGDVGGKPDPRFILEYRTETNVNFQSHAFNIGNDIDCGWQAYSGFLETFTNVCSGVLQLRIQGWEEDGAGSNFQPNIGDENIGSLSVDPFLISLNAIVNPYITTLTLTNGYQVKIKITKEVAVPQTVLSVSGNDTLCYDGSEVLTASSASASVINYKWYHDSLTNGLGSNLLFTGNNITIDSTLFSFGNNHTIIYLSGVLGSGSCESQLKRLDLYRRPFPGKPQIVDTAMAVCFNQEASIAVLNYNVGDIIEGFIDGNTSLPAGPAVSSNTFITYPLQHDARIFLRKRSLSGCVGNLWDTVKVLVTPVELPPSINNSSICQGQAITLVATHTAANRKYIWTDNNNIVLRNVQTVLGYDTLALAGNNTSGTFSYAVQVLYPTILNTGICSTTVKSVMVTVHPLPAAPSSILGDTVCPGATAALKAFASGATFNWYDAPLGGTFLGSGAIFNTVPLYVTDTFYVAVNNGTCESSRSAVIAQIQALPAPITIGDTVCTDEQATVKAQYVNGISSYNWYDSPIGGNLLFSGISYNTPSLIQTTTFYVSYELGNCTSARATATAIVDQRPIVSGLTGNIPLCAFDTLRLSIDSIPSHAVSWSGPNGYVSSVFSPIINSVNEINHEGLYKVTIRSIQNGCSAYADSIWVDVKTKPDNISAANNSPKCAGSEISFTATDVKGATYKWFGPALFELEGKEVTKEDIDTTEAGDYFVLVTKDGCVSDTIYTNVIVYPNPIADAGSDTSIIEGGSVTLNGSGGIIYGWTPHQYLSGLAIHNPQVTLPAVGAHQFFLTVYDNNSCVDTDSITVTVEPQTILEFPNVFTPNGDGVNDTWQIRYIDNIKDYKLTIFSREGKVVWVTNNYHNEWSGMQDGKELPAGAYWYQLLHNKKEYKGAITLIR